MAGDLRRVFAHGLSEARGMLGDAAYGPGALAAAFRDAAPGQRGAIGLLDTAHRDGLLGPVLSACREGRAQGQREARRMAASLVRDRLVDPAAADALAGALVDVFADGGGEVDLMPGGAPAADEATRPARDVSDTLPKPMPVAAQRPTPKAKPASAVARAASPAREAEPPAGGPRVSRRAFVVGGLAVAAAAAGLAYAGGGGAIGSESPLDGYSWEELSSIADQIAAAASDEEGLEIAKEHRLCLEDGTLDGTQLKSFELADGTEAQAQVIGFRHDARADGSGKAGITFITKDCVAERPMNEADDNSGGWEASQMRSWMNSDLLGELPDGLRAAIVPVSKLTNNVGETEVPSSVTATEDSLWLPSYVELVGPEQAARGWPNEAYGAVYSAEGSQYKLFSDQGVRDGEPNGVLVKRWDGEAALWWQRSPNPYYSLSSLDFGDVGSGGYPNGGYNASGSLGVAPGFCL